MRYDIAMQIDSIIFRLLNSLVGHGEVFDLLVIFCVQYLPYITVLAVLFFVWRQRESLKSGLNLAIKIFIPALIARFAFAEIIKEAIARPRPFIDLTDAHTLLEEGSYSFPSGHATFFFALALSVYYLDEKWGKYLFAVATLISVGRVIAGIHYPLDIVAGALVGLFVASLIHSQWEFNLNKNVKC